MEKKTNVQVMCTAFRDGMQSVYGMRVKSKDYLPALEAAKYAGITKFEAGGGAAFQSAFFYCNENAFDVMDQFRKTVGEGIELQTLARGINVVGLESQSRDVIDLHAKMFKKHGMTTIRNFDALNDPDNLLYSGQCIVNAGLKHELAISMMSLPPGCMGAHDPDFYEKTLRRIMDSGLTFHSVVFKDASGTCVPSTVYETIRRARKLIGDEMLLVYHTHETAGASISCYMAALEAGATGVDLSMAPVSGGTCQPDIATLWHVLRGTKFDLGIDIDRLMEAEEIFKDCMKKYFLPPEALSVDPRLPWSPMPGGALTANTQMLRDNGILDRYSDIIKSMEEVVRRGGYGTSVTPVSQFYFQQAFNNVMFGPWKKIAEGYGKMLLGYFGKTPMPADPELMKIASEQLKLSPTTKSPLDINDANPAKGTKAAREKLKANSLPETDENIFITATCGDKGIDFLLGKAKTSIRYVEKADAVPVCVPGGESGRYSVTVNGRNFDVELDQGRVFVDGVSYRVDARATEAGKKAAVEASSSSSQGEQAVTVKSPLPGTVMKILVSPGQMVEQGKTVVILEVMKMETEIKAPVSGAVTAVSVQQGASVTAGQVLIKMQG